LGLTQQLHEIDRQSKFFNAQQITTEIAGLFSGIPAFRMTEIFDKIPLTAGVRDFVNFLHSRKFVSCIVTDSYRFLSSRLAEKLGFHAVKANELEIHDGIVTGKVSMPLGWESEMQSNCQKKALCKLKAMHDLMNEYQITDNRTLAIGDSQGDYCIIKEAQIGVAFQPKDKSIEKAATVVIRTDFNELSRWLEGFLDRLDT
jgi:phosphoserine phosphatase